MKFNLAAAPKTKSQWVQFRNWAESWFDSEESAITTVLTPVVDQIETFGEKILLDAAKAAFEAALTSGGNTGDIIAAAAAAAIADLKTEEPIIINAIYTILGGLMGEHLAGQ